MKTRVHPIVLTMLLLVQICIADTPAITYEGGDGSSFEKAILIKNATEESGVKAEYAYLSKHFPGSQVTRQSLQQHNNRTYDVLDFNTKDGKKIIYFDITEFFGTF